MVVQGPIIITTREGLGNVTIIKTVVELQLRYDSVSQLKILMKPRCNLSKRMKGISRLKKFKCQDCRLKAGNNHLDFSDNLPKSILLEANWSKIDIV